jgi:Xaa-Pro aminopeptidase
VPAFKGYDVAGRVFPRSLCISVNHEVIHGIPSERRVLQDGDIVGLDFGVRYEGFYGDAAMTVAIGCVDDESERLMRATREALWAGIEYVRVGNRLGQVSAAIQQRAESDRFSVVREFVGHGIGKRLHEEPQVPNYGKPDRGIRLRLLDEPQRIPDVIRLAAHRHAAFLLDKLDQHVAKDRMVFHNEDLLFCNGAGLVHDAGAAGGHPMASGRGLERSSVSLFARRMVNGRSWLY